MKNSVKILAFAILVATAAVLTSFNISKKSSTLTKAEINSLLFMLEEEKMAFDVYTLMDEKWGTMQFDHIKNSEVMHMNAVKDILDQNSVKYNLLKKGKFNDKNLQKLYDALIAQGNISEVEALKAGAKIEDVDIYDLIRLKKETKNEEIINAYNFLECGSRNHLRAFTRGLSRSNATYKAEYISEKDYQEILNGDQERCGQQFGMSGNQRQMQGKGMKKGIGKMSGMNCGNSPNGNYGQKAETGDDFDGCGKCE